ncbi:MAG: CUAEP/CCAEP-tail radical SAM (seleno)protein [Acidimicrobiia bacterium]
MRVLLVSTYELGHQPLHVAAPAARLRSRGHDVRVVDLAVEPWDPAAAAWADRIACSVPMHTATRLAREATRAARAANPNAPVCFYGLYAAMGRGVADDMIAGEYEEALVRWVEGGSLSAPERVLGRPAASRPPAPPARELLPDLAGYAHLIGPGDPRPVAYVEASHGCAHRCRHCPVPVVYDGRTRVVAVDAVLADVEQQVQAGARHVTFGDPDFLNRPRHARRVVEAVHDAFPDVSFDCTVKVEHVLRHPDLWADFAACGCLFVVSAFETTNDSILERLDKGHTAADMALATARLRCHGIEVRPSWMPFTPWTTPADVVEILDFVATHDLVGNVDPVQYTIRLLLPEGSLLLGHPDLAPYLGRWDEERLTFDWTAAHPAADDLQVELAALVERRLAEDAPLDDVYASVRAASGAPPVPLPPARAVPRLTESWFCCAEPTQAQLAPLLGR